MHFHSKYLAFEIFFPLCRGYNTQNNQRYQNILEELFQSEIMYFHCRRRSFLNISVPKNSYQTSGLLKTGWRDQVWTVKESIDYRCSKCHPLEDSKSNSSHKKHSVKRDVEGEPGSTRNWKNSFQKSTRPIIDPYNHADNGSDVSVPETVLQLGLCDQKWAKTMSCSPKRFEFFNG